MKFRKKRNKFIFKVVHTCNTCGLRYYCLFDNISNCNASWNPVIGDIIFRQIIKHTFAELIASRPKLQDREARIVALIPHWIDYLIKKKFIKRKTVEIICNNGWL